MVDKIIVSLPELRGIIGLDEYGHVQVLSHDRFQQIFETIMRQQIQDDVQDNQARGRKHPRNSRSSMLARWCRLWAPYDKRCSVSAILLPDKTLAETPQAKVESLAGHWAPIFQ